MALVPLIIVLVLLNWWSFRALARRLAARRRPAVSSADQRGTGPTARAAGATDRTGSAPESSAPQPSARAFPVGGLPPGRAGAGVLEGLLRQVAGVSRAYVSPVTALAYIDYFPAQVTEEQLVRAIERGGYQVGIASRRFDWRHGHPG